MRSENELLEITFNSPQEFYDFVVKEDQDLDYSGKRLLSKKGKYKDYPFEITRVLGLNSSLYSEAINVTKNPLDRGEADALTLFLLGRVLIRVPDQSPEQVQFLIKKIKTNINCYSGITEIAVDNTLDPSAQTLVLDFACISPNDIFSLSCFTTGEGQTYKTVPFVERECCKIIDQLITLASLEG